MAARTAGPVEAAFRAWTDSLGDALNLRQRAAVAQVLSLARRMDASPDEPLSSFGTVSRELRAAADEVRERSHVGGNPPDVDEVHAPEVKRDGVADIQAARAARLKAAGG